METEPGISIGTRLPSRMYARKFENRLRAGLIPLGAALCLCFAAGSSAARELPKIPARADFIGAWVARNFGPTIYALTEKGSQQGKIIHEKMLLMIEPVKGADNLVRCRFYEWTADYSTVLGPEYGIGVYDPTTGTLTLGGPSQGINPVKLLPGPKLQYIHAKAMQDNSWMSVRYLWPLDAKAAQKIETNLKEKEKAFRK